MVSRVAHAGRRLGVALARVGSVLLAGVVWDADHLPCVLGAEGWCRIIPPRSLHWPGLLVCVVACGVCLALCARLVFFEVKESC